MLEKGIDLDTFIYNNLYEKSKDMANEWSEESPIVVSRGIRNDMVTLNHYLGEVLFRQIKPIPLELKSLTMTVCEEKYLKRVEEVLIPTMLKHRVKFKIE